jgi:hypothetical protein
MPSAWKSATAPWSISYVITLLSRIPPAPDGGEFFKSHALVPLDSEVIGSGQLPDVVGTSDEESRHSWSDWSQTDDQLAFVTSAKLNDHTFPPISGLLVRGGSVPPASRRTSLP